MKELQQLLSSLLLLLTLSTVVFAFVPTSTTTCNCPSRLPAVTTTMTTAPIVASSPRSRAAIFTALYAAQAPLPPEPLDIGFPAKSDSSDKTSNNHDNPCPPTTRRRMHEDVYNFNKFVIDTVYNIICYMYPITGTSSRDYARFYVLETVARVPYFGKSSYRSSRKLVQKV